MNSRNGSYRTAYMWALSPACAATRAKQSSRYRAKIYCGRFGRKIAAVEYGPARFGVARRGRRPRPLDVEGEGELTLLELAPSYKTFAKS